MWQSHSIPGNVSNHAILLCIVVCNVAAFAAIPTTIYHSYNCGVYQTIIWGINMFSSFIITFREGLEAFLIVGGHPRVSCADKTNGTEQVRL